MFPSFATVLQQSSETISQTMQPAVIAAIIAALVTLPSVFLSFRSLRIQRLQSERNEIYKKLNDFYGPMRLHLKSSKELYDLFAGSITKRLKLNPKEFRTLPFLLNGDELNATESALFKQIIAIGKRMEVIIGRNAGLIDDDNLHKDMIKLCTHIRIIRMAYNKEFLTGSEKEVLLECKTFPNDITKSIDKTFYEFKNRLNKLNKKRIKKLKKKGNKPVTNSSPCPG
jgi:hypothetical protein